jgi:hypothetical protein
MFLKAKPLVVEERDSWHSFLNKVLSLADTEPELGQL